MLPSNIGRRSEAVPESKASVLRAGVYFLAYGFGSGCLPLAPGTWGTLAAVPIYLLLTTFCSTYLVLITLLMCIAGIYICDFVVRDGQRADPPEVVWDEICGYLITMLFCPVQWYWMLAGFVLFRAFDIYKPWPIAWSETYFRGGLGVMVDDVLAAVYSGLILGVVQILLKLS
jgi:phosphatidylglycerophosphatase A